MRAHQINRFSGIGLILLSVIALLAVVSGYIQGPQPDEGAAAHIFQLAVLALVPTLILFFSTVDWKRPLRNTRLLAIPAVTLAVAFTALYYLEHYR